MWTPTHVQVTVNRARNLIPKGKGGTNDCYVSIGLGKEKYQTSVKEKCTDPEWQEECDLALEEMGKTAAKVRLKVYHKNTLGADDLLGFLELPLSDFPIYETPRNKWYELTDKPGKKKASEKYRGELEVKLAFTVQSKSSSTLSLNNKSIIRTGSFRSITNIGEKFKLPKRSGSFKEKNKDEKEKKSKLAIFDPFNRKKSGSKLSLGKSKEDLNASHESQFYDESDEGSVNLENFDADTVFKKVNASPAKPARLAKSNKLSQQQRLSVSVPGLMLIKKDAEFAAMKAFPQDDDSVNEDDIDNISDLSLTDSNTTATPKMVTLSPGETFNFDEDTWDQEDDKEVGHNPFEEEKKVAPNPFEEKKRVAPNPFEKKVDPNPFEEEKEVAHNPFVRSSPAKKHAPPPPVPVKEPVKEPIKSARVQVKEVAPVRDPVIPTISTREPERKPINVVKPDSPSNSPPPMPKSRPPPQPQTSTPTLDSVISSIGLGNSSPLVAPRSPQLSEKDSSLDSSNPLRLSARITSTPPAHGKLEVMKNNEDAGFSRSGSYRQPIGRGSKRVKRAASDADAKKPDQSDESSQLSDSREMASSMGRLDDKDSALIGRHGNTLSSSEESQTRSAHSIPEVIFEVESPTREEFRSFGETGRQREDRKNNKMERKYSADGRQSLGDFPPSEQRLVLGEESKESRKSKSVVLPPEVLEQYADYSREELIRMVHQQKKEMERKQNYVKDLENYIDNLLVRVMEVTPKLLQKPPEVQNAGHPGFPTMTNGHHRDSQKIQARNTRY